MRYELGYGEKVDEDESEVTADEPGMADDEPPVISTKVAVAHVGVLLSFAMRTGNNVSMIDITAKAQTMVEEHSCSRQASGVLLVSS